MESILAGLASNAMSEMHAGNQYEREVKLMRKQQAMNQENVLGAYQNEVNGMKMAGLSPAGAMNQAPTVPTVSKGSVGMAENVEFDPSTMLLEAQAENLKAQTEKTEAETDKITGADTKNTEADTNLKIQEIANKAKDVEKTDAEIRKMGAETALINMETKTEGFKPNLLWAQAEKAYKDIGLTDEQIKKVKAETNRIWQLNQEYADHNTMLQKLGPQIAEDIINSENYEILDDATKQYWKNVKSGKIKLTVGGMAAVNELYNTNSNLTEKDALNNDATLNKIVLKRQLFNEDTIKALGQLPAVKAKQVEATLNETIQKVENLIKENKLNELEIVAKELDNKIKAISPEGIATTGDGWEYIKSLGRSYAEDPSKLVIPAAAGKYLTSGASKGAKNAINKAKDKWEHRNDYGKGAYKKALQRQQSPLKSKGSSGGGIQNINHPKH